MIYAITGGFILLDLLTGLVKSFAQHNYSSSVMRQGLFHKCGSILCIIFGVLVDMAQAFMDLGVSIPVAISVCAYIALMEVGSIIENICQINPEIMPEKLTRYFSKLTGGKDSD